MVAKYAQKYKIVITFSITSMSRKMVLWLKTLKHLIIQVLILAVYKKSRQSFNVALNCILILGNYNWVSDTDFLDVGENWSQVWMYFTLLALWLSFLLITWDPLGRLKGAANAGEIFRSKITCWECFVIGVQRLFYLHLLNLPPEIWLETPWLPILEVFVIHWLLTVQFVSLPYHTLMH